MSLPTYSQLATALTKFFTATDKAHDIVNGPASGDGSTVTVTSGVIPTFSKRLSDLNNITVLTPSSNYELTFPTGTFSLGDVKRYNITPTAGIDLSFHVDISIPSDSIITFPKALTADLLYIVRLEYAGTFWMLTTIQGGHSA